VRDEEMIRCQSYSVAVKHQILTNTVPFDKFRGFASVVVAAESRDYCLAYKSNE